MLETIREYAAEQLEVSGERLLVEDRLIDAACEFARTAEPAWHVGGADEWLPRFDLERGNLRRANAAALERGDVERALTISSQLTWLWQARGLMREGNDWTERGLKAAEKLEPALEGYASFGLGVGLIELGEPDRGLELVERALPLLEAGGLAYHHAFALGHRGRQLLRLGRFAEAEEVLRRSQQEAVAVADPTLIGSATVSLAEAYADQGDRAGARALLERVTVASIPNKQHRVTHATVFAELLAADGETDRAKSILDEAAAICEEGGYTRELAWVLLLRAYLDIEDGCREAAIPALEAARAMGDESGVRGVVRGALLGLAVAEARWGSPEAAVALWSQARPRGVPSGEDSWDLGRKLERAFLEPLRGTVPSEAFDRAWAAGRTEVR
jgi:tetratricopeptide (TPR) repeat protein